MLGAKCIHLGVLYCFDIILICLTGDCLSNKLKLRDPFKSYEKVPSIRLQWIFPINQCNVDKFVGVSDA